MKGLLPASFLFVCSLFAVGQSPYASLQVPRQIHYQGRVATGTGGAWGGTEGYFAFALVQGATVLWNNWEGTASPSDPGTVSLGAGQVLTFPVSQGVFSIRLGEGSDTNEQIPATVFFDTTSNAVRTGLKLAVWFSPSGSPPFTRLSPDVEFLSVPFAMVAGIAEMIKERAVTTTMLADASVSSAKVVDGTLEAGDLSVALQADSLIPPGSVMPFAGTAAPVGWVFCDGSSHSRTDPVYARLNSVIGITHGGNASTFNLPDYRGRFMRGADAGAGRDPNRYASSVGGADGNRYPMNSGGSGNLVGSIQNDAFQGHYHNFQFAFNNQGATNARPYYSGTGTVLNAANDSSLGRALEAITDGTNGIPRVGFETRPHNAYVNYIIKL